MKSRREEVTQKYWDKMWADIEAFFAEADADLEMSREMFVQWNLAEEVTSITADEILNPPKEKPLFTARELEGLRFMFAAIADDWNDPSMDVYDQ